MTLRIDALSKRFGTVQALDGISFTVAQGEVFGFLGANGAGKTTTMRIVLGLMKPDAGSATWQGEPTESWPRRMWGYMPEDRGLYLRMKVIDQLVHFAALYGVPRAAARAEALDWLARFRIADLAERRAETLSKGNQQKVQFIATVLQQPDVLLMDEPFVGLDPVNVALLRAAFLELRDSGRTIVFSTHQLDQAQALCDSVAIIDHGRLVTTGPTLDVRRSTGRRAVRIATSSTAADGAGWLAQIPGVTVTGDSNDQSELRVDADMDPQSILRAALERGEEVLTFEVGDPSLEDVFVERVGTRMAVEEATLASGARPAAGTASAGASKEASR